MRRPSSLAAAASLSAVVALGLLVAPAWAVTDRWAAWSALGGGPGRYTATMQQQASGFPAATMSSDSRGAAQIAAGTSVLMGPGTPPGAKYGSSAGSPYAVLRPRADSPTAPSTTTYAFDRPTPDTGWAFVLGDVDADQVRVSATDQDGAAVPADEIDSWFAGTFNTGAGTDLPSWDPGTSTLVGNPGALDTDGASGWFEPDVRLTGLTLTFTRRAGFPVYQTWFVSRARPVGGVVTDVSATGACPLQDATVTLLSPGGDELATTSPGSDGSYDLGEHATQGGYLVRLDLPPGCAVVGPAELGVSNRGNDGDPASRADFAVRVVVPQAVSGTVRDGSAAPVAGVLVTLTDPGGATRTTTTGTDGTYLFDDNAVGTGYQVSVAVPPGYAAGPDGTVRDDVEVASVPVTGQDFLLAALADVSGTVTGGGGGLGGVQVVLTPVGGGPPRTTTTRGDGGYVLDGVLPGGYLLAVTPPAGFTGGAARPVTVGGSDVVRDVALARPGAIGGQVTTGDGVPVAAVQVLVDGPGGARSAGTDAEGRYFLDDLPAGSYTVEVLAPRGSVVVGPATRAVEITAAGEVRGGEDFVLADAPAPGPPPVPPPAPGPVLPDPGPGRPAPGDPGAPAAPAAPGGTLPATGASAGASTSAALALLLVGAVLVRLSRDGTGRAARPRPHR